MLRRGSPNILLCFLDDLEPALLPAQNHHSNDGPIIAMHRCLAVAFFSYRNSSNEDAIFRWTFLRPQFLLNLTISQSLTTKDAMLSPRTVAPVFVPANICVAMHPICFLELELVLRLTVSIARCSPDGFPGRTSSRQMLALHSLLMSKSFHTAFVA